MMARDVMGMTDGTPRAADDRRHAAVSRAGPIIAAVLCAVLTAGVVASCAYPPFDRDASEALRFRRWLEEHGELVERFEIYSRDFYRHGEAVRPQYVPAMGIDAAEPRLVLDNGIFVVERFPEVEMMHIRDGEFDGHDGWLEHLRYARDRYNAWDVRPAIDPVDFGGVIAFYARTDGSDGSGDTDFQFEIGTVSGLGPGSSQAVVERAIEPLPGITGDDRRVLGIGLTTGALSLLVLDDEGGDGQPPVLSLRLYRSRGLHAVIDPDEGDDAFGAPQAQLAVDGESALAVRALAAGTREVGRVFTELPVEIDDAPDVFSPLGDPDPLGIEPDSGAAGALLGTFPDGDSYRTAVAGVRYDPPDSELPASVDEVSDRVAYTTLGFASGSIFLGADRSRLESYSPESLESPRLRQSFGTVHYIASLPANYVEAATGGGEFDRTEFTSYFSHAQPIRGAFGEEFVRVSVYAVPSARLEE